jgi:8-oxo-dGTP pyrophosphatase MutT (NUDIX family)
VIARSPTSGEEHDFYCIESAEWVNVVPVTTDGQVVMVRQFRHGSQTLTLEIPGGMIDAGETPAEAALRETREEVGLSDLRVVGPIRVIDWRFRAKGGHLIHKFCHFFLLESPADEPSPQLDEGITACRWCPLDEAMADLSYDNARGVLRRAGEMARTLVAIGAGRPRDMPKPIPHHHHPS